MTAPADHAEPTHGSPRRPHGLRDLRRLVRYGISGGTAATVHLGVLTLLVELGGLRPVVASAVGFLCGFVVSYLLQRRWVFATDHRHGFTLPRFVVVIGLGLLINTAVLWLGTEYLEHHYALVQLAAFAVVPLNNYVLNSLWTFR
jgi:putative flippase GtrA